MARASPGAAPIARVAPVVGTSGSPAARADAGPTHGPPPSTARPTTSIRCSPPMAAGCISSATGPVVAAATTSIAWRWAPTPSRDGQRLLFASDGMAGAGRHDLFVARWNGHAFVDPKPVPGINTADDDFDAAWLDDGRAIVFARSTDADKLPIQLFVARCDGARYVDAKPLALSFNTADGWTLGPAIDWNKPNELLVSGAAKAPHAGKLDIYRMAAPRMEGRDGCT